MSESDAAAGETRRFNLLAWLSGRASRKEFWLWFVILMAAGAVLDRVGLSGGSPGIAIVFFAIQSRRMHDFGLSGWWGAGVNLIALVLAVAVVLSGVPGGVDMGLLAWACIMIPYYLWLGIRRGHDGENRFGPPPKGDLKSILMGR
jgi:uncharacterized membrane protein YhaH (DUF805 family)